MALFLYNPTAPFQKVEVPSYTIDSSFELCAIAKSLLVQVQGIERRGARRVRTRSGLLRTAPTVEFGLQIGRTALDRVHAYVLEDNTPTFVLGRELVNQLLEAQGLPPGPTHPFYEKKYSSEDLVIEIHPVERKPTLLNLQYFFRALRQLYVVILISTDPMWARSVREVGSYLDSDDLLPPSVRLRISEIDQGSIVIALASASKKSLQYLGNVFQKRTTANLKREIAESGQAELEFAISKEIRPHTARARAREQDALAAKSISKTYDVWRKEARSRVALFNDLIAEVSDPSARKLLVSRKDQALLTIAEQQLMLFVRNLPGSDFPDEPRPSASPPPELPSLPVGKA